MAHTDTTSKTTYFARTKTLVFNEVDAGEAGLVLEVVGETGRVFIRREELSHIINALDQWKASF